MYTYLLLLLSGGVTNQSIPIVLPVHTNDKTNLDGCAAFTLRYDGKPIAVLRNPEFYEHRKEERCSRQFGTSNTGHPYVKVPICDFKNISFMPFSSCALRIARPLAVLNEI